MEYYELERFGRHFLSFLLIGIACYMGLVLFAHGEKFWSAISEFPLSYIPFLLALASLNFLLRYFRWQIYLKTLGIHLPPWRSFLIFMAGLTMTITPGKAGEALKAHLLKIEGDNPWSIGLPVVFAERLTDLMGVVILVALGLRILPVGKEALFLGICVCLLLLLISTQPTLFNAMVRFLAKLPWMPGRSEWLLEMHGYAKRLLAPRTILAGVLISSIAWFAECMVLYFTLVACQSGASYLNATFIYALSLLAGALSILPGGLVATEGSMTGLLLLFGLERNKSVLVTLIVRLCTLWFAIFVGMIFLFFLRRRTRLKGQPMLGKKVLP
jgi:uncharacterized protein (TIRG00374 family)